MPRMPSHKSPAAEQRDRRERLMTACFVLNPPIHFLPPPSPSPSTINHWCLPPIKTQNNIRFSNPILHLPTQFSSLHSPRFSRPTTTAAQTTTSSMAANQTRTTVDSVPNASMNLLFVEMGVGYDQHGQDVTAAAMRACRDAISSNSIPAFRRGSIPGVTFEQMKLQIKLGVPKPLQQFLDIEKVKSIFPYGDIMKFEVVDGGLICSSGVHVEEMGDKNDDCYIVNAAVYVGY